MLNEEILATFRGLLEEARGSTDPEPTAMNLSTATPDGRVHGRIVLLKSVDERGFRFYTNYESAKAEQIAEHPQVALTFHWKHVRDGVQVRVQGRAERLPEAESDAYFAGRPRGSQIGAWASLQSRPLPDRATFEARVAQYEQEFEGRDVPRPPHWGGYLVVADSIEFWYAGEFRLHERVRWQRMGKTWTSSLLYP
ncbi:MULTISPECIES: pyridoxamine 5'-phosphate oxidase [Oleiagrimonas]|uniref:Pyridoxine/pyridoxamine 5'-phosphate oxidase n=1 Tax=Oleiagrimonas citrea TaxID=1665687 RepID=A0A846ZKT5_9GAMM|nr:MULTISPECIES: pyridoxamine 5'-phosphate oxidase [Oleiagrimonas]NKZ38140.1 pyridoxamine 5'-phosphate oxidase [Oleiagrimonas citrea]RAP58545.1 pyridoxamine 5'-phosphate oxidase [Oleiagrimonas sp. MCCC 1A03011]